MSEPKTMPATIPHGELPNRRSAPQPRISIKTIDAKKTIPADQARPLLRVVSAKDSGSAVERTNSSFSVVSLSSESVSKRLREVVFFFRSADFLSIAGSLSPPSKFLIIPGLYAKAGITANASPRSDSYPPALYSKKRKACPGFPDS